MSIFDPSKCNHPEWNDGAPERERLLCDNCSPWAELCGRYGHPDCQRPAEETWVFCHEHRMGHCGPTPAEEEAAAFNRGFITCREAARQRLTEEARAFLVEFGPSDAARIAMDCMRHAEDIVAKLQPPADVTVTVREQKGKR